MFDSLQKSTKVAGPGVQFNDCSPEALRVGGLVSQISRGAGLSALVLLASCLGQLLTARVLLSLWQFECCLL